MNGVNDAIISTLGTVLYGSAPPQYNVDNQENSVAGTSFHICGVGERG